VKQRDSRGVSDRAGERTLFSQAQIAKAVQKLAREIARAPLKPEIAVPVLAGAFVFASDLMRALARHGLDLETEFVWLRSYGRSESPSDVMVLKAPSELVRGRTVLLIDGVLDSGATLARAKELLEEEGAAAVITAVAVEKEYPGRRFRADHAMFAAGTEFLYGYGMDHMGRSRGLPDIRVKGPVARRKKKKARE
jgi:hypoxanthine phosphoribosyltransferase